MYIDISTSNIGKLTTQLLALFVLFSIAAVPVQAQERNLDRELLVYILPDSLELPAKVQERASIDEAEIGSNALYTVMRDIGINNVERAFPEWEAADSVRVLESGRVVHRPKFHRVFIMHLPHSISSDEAVELLDNEPSVVYVHPHLNAQPETDTYYPDQWHLNNTGQAGGTAGADIQAEDAWNIFTGSSDIKIGIFDTGIDHDHVDLEDKVTELIGFVYEADHGTHVAALAAGKANNQDGLVRGVDWNAQVVSAPIMDANSIWIGDNHFASSLVDAVDNYDVHILNHSWGRSQTSPTVGSALAYAYDMNRLNVTSAGNQGSGGLTFPASMGHGIIAVGATDNNDSRSPGSSYGSKLNVTAPGGTNIGGPYDDEDIMSAMTGNDAGFIAGTSMASPIVTGIASLLKGYDSDLYNDDIQRIIELSADEVGNVTYDNNGWHEQYGYGRVNAYEALKLLQEPYELHHYTTSGGTVHNTQTGWMTFYGLPGYAGGVYSVKQYDVRKSVNFSWMDEPNVWGRGVESVGYSNESPNFTMGFTDVVSNTNNSAVLRTYVYQIYTINGAYLGWFPTTPGYVEFAYTVHGVPEVEPPSPPSAPALSGSVTNGMPHLSWNSVTGATSYKVNRISYNAQVTDATFTTTNTSYTDGSLPFNVEIDFGIFDNIAYNVQAVNSAGESLPSNEIIYGEQGGWFSNYQDGSDTIDITIPSIDIIIPSSFALHNNYPNPFNPTTTIRFDLPEQAFVSISVYDIMGRQVSSLASSMMSAGTHNLSFDASNLSSGIYIARFTATGSTGELFKRDLKMQLIK